MPMVVGTRIIKVVRLYLDIVFVVGMLACIGLTVWLLISPLVMAGGETIIEAAIQVAIGSRSIRPLIPVESVGSGGSAVISPKIVDAQGELRFRTSNWRLQFVSNARYLIAAIIIVTIIYLVRRVLREVAADMPFGPENARRVRVIGLILLLAGIVRPVIEFVTSRIVLSQIPATDPALSAAFHIESETVVGGLLILILAQVWVHSAQLAEDQALTV